LTSQNPKAQIEFPVAEGQAYECEVFSASQGQLSDIRIVADRIAPAPSPEQLIEIQIN
jgi:hypothetical protein